MTHDDSSSTRARLYAPTPLAESWSLVTSQQGTENERLVRRFAFVEQLLRLCCGLLDAERAARGLQAPGDRKALIRQLDRPTLGHRAIAAEALAKRLRTDAPTSVLAPLAIALSDESSPLHRALDRLVEVRNRWAHDSLTSVSEEECRRSLAETKPEILALAGVAELLWDAPVVVVERVEHPLRGPDVAKVVVFVGLDQTVIEHRDPPPLRPRQPYLLTEAGLATPLAPWVMFGRFQQPTEHLRLLDRVTEGAPCQATFVRGDDPRALPHPELTDDLRQPEAMDALMGRLVGPDSAITALWRAVVATRRASGATRPTLAGYSVGRLLGRGGSGAVWEATRHADGRILALKVLRPELIDSHERRARLMREHHLLSRLSHPGLARVYALLADTPLGPILELERVEGEPLSTRLRDGPMEPKEAARLCLRLLDALRVVHDAGVVHRDLKPENVLLQPDGAPRIVDFGVAWSAQSERLTGTLDRLGTTGFAAPEQHQGAPLDRRADLYAVGKLLVWMCSPTSEAPRLSALPGPLQRVARRVTQVSPAERHPDAQSLIAELSEALDEGEDGAPVGLGALLPGGLRIVRQLSAPRSGVYLFRAEPLGGGELAVLVSGASAAAQRSFKEALLLADTAALRAMRCNGVRVSEDGLLYAELTGEDAEAHAARLFSAAQPSSAWDNAPDATTVLAGVGAAAALGAAALGAVFAKRAYDERTKVSAAAERPAEQPVPPTPAPKATPAQKAAVAGLGALLLGKALAPAPTTARPGEPAPATPPPSPAAVLAQAQLIGLLLIALARTTGERHVTELDWVKLCATPLASLAVSLGPEGATLTGPVGDSLSALGDRGQALVLLTKLNHPGVGVEELRAAVQRVRDLREIFRKASAWVRPEALAPYARRGADAWEVRFVMGRSASWTKALPVKG